MSLTKFQIANFASALVWATGILTPGVVALRWRLQAISATELRIIEAELAVSHQHRWKSLAKSCANELTGSWASYSSDRLRCTVALRSRVLLG